MGTGRIYMVSYYFAPLGRADGVNRALLVQALSKLGWSIDVLSCSNPHAFLRSFQHDPTLLDLIPGEVNMHRVPSPFWGPVGQIAFLAGLVNDPFLNWRRPASEYSDDHFREPGVIYAIVPPIVNLLVASELAARRGWPLVVDFRDNVPGIPRRALANVSGIVASTRRSLEEMSAAYSIDSPGIVFFNGCPEPAGVSRIERPSDGLRVVYTGLMGMETHPAMLLETHEDLAREDPVLASKVNLDFIGPRNYYTRIFMEGRLRGHRLLGYLSYQESRRAMAAADICFVSIRGSKKSYCIPSKVFQYMSAGAPILAFGPEGEMGGFITDNGIGLFADCSDRKARLLALSSMAGDSALLAGMRVASKAAAARYGLGTQVYHLDRFLNSFLPLSVAER